MTQATKRSSGRAGGAGKSDPPNATLQTALHNLTETLTGKAVASLSDRLSGATERLTQYAEGAGGAGLLSAAAGADKLTSGGSAVTAAVSGGLSGAGHKAKNALKKAAQVLPGHKDKSSDGGKITNIVEQIDVGVPIDLAYRQWTEFTQFPKFMKKVEQVEQLSDEKVRWKAQVFLSHRTWESTITEQVPDERIVWRSEGEKGYVDGAVTFHELGPNLTRVIVVLEYHPQGFFEKTGNLWRAQGRRVRLELKNFQREAMAHATLHPDDIEGWRGRIRDGETVAESDVDVDEADVDDEERDEEERHDQPPPRQRRGQDGGRRRASATNTRTTA